MTRKISYNIRSVDVRLDSSFNSMQIFNGDILFRATPIGFGTMRIFISVDGTLVRTIETTVSNRQVTHNIPKLSHGSHIISAYMEIVDEDLVSNTLIFDVISVDVGNNTPIISSSFSIDTAEQYGNLTIPFRVYDPLNMPANIELLVDGEVTSTRSVDRTLQT